MSASELRDYAGRARGRPGAAGRDRGAARGDRPAGAQARRQRRVGAGPRRALPGGDRPAGGRRGARRRGGGRAGRGRGAAREARRAAERGPHGCRRGRCESGSPTSWSGWRCRVPRLEVVLEPHPDGFGPNGRETVELRVAPNPGIEPAPLRDAASGGELSRVMLALSGLGEASRRRHPGLRRDRRRGRRQHRAGRRRASAGARRRVARSSASPTCPRSPRSPDPLPAREGRRAESAPPPRSSGSTARSVVEEIRRMLGGESADEAADRHARELLAAA